MTIGATIGFASVDVNPAGIEVQAYENPPGAGAPNWILSPTHIVSSLPVSTTGKGFTVTITESSAVSPLVSVTVTVYSVVTDGLTFGFELFGLLILGSFGTEAHS